MGKYKPPGGIYFLYEKGEIVYVGQTNDIFRRISEHSRGGQKHGVPDKEFDDWSYIRCEDDALRENVESMLILHLHPKYNMDAKCFYRHGEQHSWNVEQGKMLDINPEDVSYALGKVVA